MILAELCSQFRYGVKKSQELCEIHKGETRNVCGRGKGVYLGEGQEKSARWITTFQSHRESPRNPVMCIQVLGSSEKGEIKRFCVFWRTFVTRYLCWLQNR